MLLRPVVAAVLAAACSGCGLGFQLVAGWTEERTESVVRQHPVRVETVPPGRALSRRGPDGNLTTLGAAPIEERLDYHVIETRERPKELWPFWTGLGLDVLAFTPGLLVTSLDDTPRPGAVIPLAIMLAATLAADFIGLSQLHPSEERVIRSEPVGGGTVYTYAMSLEGGAAMEARLRAPWDSSLQLVAPAATQPAGIVAVMDVRDSNEADAARKLDPLLLSSLGDQLRVQLARGGFRTVDKGQQQAALAERVRALKLDSYQSCYDQSCQIEVGKALAASLLLRSQIGRIGSSCVLICELIDLRTEVAVQAASTSGPCDLEAVLAMSQQVAQQLRPN